MNTTVVACCQVAPALADPAANRELAAHAISHAAAQGASVVVLPNWSPAWQLRLREPGRSHGQRRGGRWRHGDPVGTSRGLT